MRPAKKRLAVPSKDAEVVLKEGRFLRLVRRGAWEYVQRHHCTGIVIVLAVTEEGRLLLTEQFRVPVQAPVIEFPAGLVNDRPGAAHETPKTAARRELLEETGYRARSMTLLAQGPAAGGSSSDHLMIFRAAGLTRVAEGGGDETEDIRVHEVPLDAVDLWLARQSRRGARVDPKIYAGLYLLRKYNV